VDGGGVLLTRQRNEEASTLAQRADIGGPDRRGPEPFRHEALLYGGFDGFLEGTVPFLRAGADAGDAMLVVVDTTKIDALRETLGTDAPGVTFADMAEVGANPARIIPAWRAFVDAHPERRLRGIGEPISPARSPAELVECQRHEELLNLAFADAAGFSLLCPYDVDALDPGVIELAHHSHALVVSDGAERASSNHLDLDVIAAPFAEPLPDAPDHAHAIAFERDTLAAVRDFVESRALAAGLSAERAGDLVLAVNELATNSVTHGGGQGVLRVWSEPDAVLCEISDSGAVLEPLAGREQPTGGRVGGHGLWLCNQLCDLVQIRAFRGGGVVRLHMYRSR
jgi:anti-sigma regulatory factor (Ser/Thr protein kinase)